MAATKKARTGEEFEFCNGTKASTIAQCRKELAKLTPEQFGHHVNAERNDIFVWVRDCLDEDLADRIRDVRNRDDLIQALQAGAPRKRRA
jgi:hypothetical protein